MYEAGLIAIGALSVLVALLGVVVYWARNHRIDLSGIAIRREWTPLEARELRQAIVDSHMYGTGVTGTETVQRRGPGWWAAGLSSEPTEAQRAVSEMVRAGEKRAEQTGGMQHGSRTERVGDDE